MKVSELLKYDVSVFKSCMHTNNNTNMIVKSIGDVLLSTFKPAETFKIGEYEFFVLEQLGDKTIVLLKDLLQDDVQFPGLYRKIFRGSLCIC